MHEMAHWLVRQITNKGSPQKCKNIFTKRPEAGAYIEKNLFGGRIVFDPGYAVYFVVGDEADFKVYKISGMMRVKFVRYLLRGKKVRDWHWDVNDTDNFERVPKDEENHVIKDLCKAGNIISFPPVTLMLCGIERERLIAEGIDPNLRFLFEDSEETNE